MVSKVPEKIQNSSLKKNIYTLKLHDEKIGHIYLESNLFGHNDSISSVKLGYKNSNSNDFYDMTILSSSFDFSVQIWERELETGIWMNSVRLGQFGGNKNAFFGVGWAKKKIE